MEIRVSFPKIVWDLKNVLLGVGDLKSTYTWSHQSPHFFFLVLRIKSKLLKQ